MRKPLMVANWKMYKTAAETRQFFRDFKPMVEKTTHADAVVCPTYLSLPTAIEETKGTKIGVGAQNLHFKPEGAYTGEVSAHMIQETGARWVIIGHSERRRYFLENDDQVIKKTEAALEGGLTPIVCVGERIEERECGNTELVLTEQFANGIAELSPEDFAKIVIAYEPVWAIGTGRVATPEIAGEAHALLREQIRLKYGQQLADSTRILYGGSVKPDNIRGLMAMDGIDGALIGGASLEPKSFYDIIHF
jgi:triosephosphate isomerase (TIM)